MEFEEIIENKSDDKIDLRNLKCSPTTVLPLLCECSNKSLKLDDGSSAFEFLESNLKNSKFFSPLPNSRYESDETDFLTNYVDNLDSSYGGYFVLRTIISELANKVYDHSGDNGDDVKSYICSKLDSHCKKLEICVIDDGLSIPGIFEKYNVGFDNGCKAIEKAIGTFSTITDSDYERGNGFWTILRLVCEGNGGEMLIVSRRGCLHICGDYYRYYLLHSEHIFNGTLVAVRLNRYKVQNIYDLIEFNQPNSFRLGAINDY